MRVVLRLGDRVGEKDLIHLRFHPVLYDSPGHLKGPLFGAGILRYLLVLLQT